MWSKRSTTVRMSGSSPASIDHGGLDSGDAFALDVEVTVRQPSRGYDAVATVASEPHAQDGEMLVSLRDQMCGKHFHCAPVVDGDEGGFGDVAGLVADDDRQMTFANRSEVRVVVGDGVDDEPVDSGLLHDGGGLHVVAFGTGGDEQ